MISADRISNRDRAAHTLGDKVEAAHRRSDGFEKRRLLAEEWAKQCAKVKTEPAPKAA